MNVQTIIDRARSLTYTSSGQYPDAKAIEDFNIVNKELVDLITQEVDENFFWDIYTADTVAGQSEYSLTSINVSKVSELYIKYNSTDTFYTKAKLINEDELSKDPVYYENYQSKTNPLFYIADNSLFILPAPDSIVTDGIKMNAIKQQDDLLITDLEADIILPTRFHHLIAEGMKPYIYQRRGLFNEKNDSANEFLSKKINMIFDLSDRDNTPQETGLPSNLDYYA